MALALAALLVLASHPVTIPFWMLVLGTPLFLFKKRRMPSCSFRIGCGGIERTSRTGTLVRAWSDVTTVRRYRRGYLLLLDKGAVPIPYRCMDKAQQEAFRKLARAPVISVSRAGADRNRTSKTRDISLS
ncbi:YcxB family protein [Massilia sp. TN1-12]|uniref:YcxB family protein n=1 Tax=Massilia paldalensis TaxID=3377675 RepID=UPI00384DEA82